MSQEQHTQEDCREFGKNNWVSSSRFLFYLSILCFLGFFTGCSYNVYKSTRYHEKPKVEVQPSTLYKPEYK